MEHVQENKIVDSAESLETKPVRMSRRSFLTTAAASAAVVASASSAFAGTDKFGRDRDWTGEEPVTYPEPAFEVKDKRFSGRQGNATLQRIWHGMGNDKALWCEGPVWMGDWGCLLWSDIPNHRVLRWNEDDGHVSVYQTESGYSNGHGRDNQGRLIASGDPSKVISEYLQPSAGQSTFDLRHFPDDSDFRLEKAFVDQNGNSAGPFITSAPVDITLEYTVPRSVAGLRVGPGERLVDLACGSGGPGLWIARASGADLVGVDWSPVAVEAARRRAADFLPEGRARFVVGELADSGLPSGQAAAAVCLDAVAFAPDRVAALREVRRLLRADGRYVFSATEVASPPDRSWVTDWQPLLAAADLQIESKDEVPRYAQRLQRMYDLWLENLGPLEAEVGVETAAKLAQEARAVGPTLRQRRQFLIVARP